MNDKVNDKKTERRENNSSRPIYIIFFILTLIFLSITYMNLVIGVKIDPKKVEPAVEYTCEIVDDEYWGKDGKKVDKETYEKECIPVEPVYKCKIVNGEYWGKDLKKVSEEVYKKECVKEIKYTCKIVNGEYWGKGSVKVDKETYEKECVIPTTYTCKIVNNEYWGKNSIVVDEETYKKECLKPDPQPIEDPNWIIIFENVSVKDGSVTAIEEPTLSGLKTSLTYSVALMEPGQYYSFDVDIANKGNLDAKIYDISSTILTETQKKYLEYTIKYKNGSEISVDDTLLSGERKTITVWLKFRNDMTSASDLPATDDALTLKYEIIYVEK